MHRTGSRFYTSSLLLPLLWLGLAGSAQAANRYRDDADNSGLSITERVDPTYPAFMQMRGIHSGAVGLVISVNAEGKLVDKLVVAYTDEGFVRPVLEAVDRWEFDPAKVNGVARASRVELQFEFKSDLNVIVNTNSFDLMRDFIRDRYEYRPYALKELDRIPTPTHVVNPVIPDGQLKPGEERVVTVEFYIDEQGRVRIPAVPRKAADDELAAAAVQAVEKWTFEPPQWRKSPVLVRAQQDFRFVAKAK